MAKPTRGGNKAREPRKKKAERKVYPEKQLAALEKVENRIYKNKNEQVNIVDREGNVVFKKYGDEGSVDLKYSETENFNGPDFVLTHNHPLTGGRKIGGTFSPADINSMLRLGHSGVRATAVEGTYDMQYVGNSDKDKYEFVSAYREVVDNMIEDVKRKRKEAKEAFYSADPGRRYRFGQSWFNSPEYKEFDAGQKKIFDDGMRDVHKWLTKNASSYGFQYTFTERKAK